MELFVMFVIFIVNCLSSSSTEAFSTSWSYQNGGQFARGGFPQLFKKRAVGTSVQFECSHFIYSGTSNAPLTRMTWYKDGDLLTRIPGKIKIFGYIEHPPYNNSKLSISNLTYQDAGNYSCELRLLLSGISETDPPLVCETFTLKIKGRKKTGVAKPSETSQPPDSHQTIFKHKSTSFNVSTDEVGLDAANKTSTAVKVVALIVVFSFFILVLLKCLKCLDFKLQRCRKSDRRKGIKEERRLTSSHVEQRNDVKLQKCSVQEPEYINEENYRVLFPFINDEEWLLLKQSHIHRDCVKCDVKYSMPIVLGTGNFGHVYRGEVTLEKDSKKLCAVKRLNDNYKPQDLGHFLMEAITLLKAGHHCNVISLVGSVLLDAISIASENQDLVRRPPILLMELASEGNLKHYLSDRRLESHEQSEKIGISYVKNHPVGRDLTVQDLISFTYQSARGMQHLSNQKIIHRDLAARNVLVTSNKVIKIADFGLSKHVRNLQQEYYRVHSPSMTPAKWTAPEALSQNKFSEKSDVWSYGILIWEIFSMGCDPYQDIPISQLYRRLSSSYRLPKPKFAIDAIYKVMKSCWSWEADCRPDFKHLVTFFENSLLTVSSESYWDLDRRIDSALSSTSTEDNSKTSSMENLGSDSVFFSDSSGSSAGIKDSAFSSLEDTMKIDTSLEEAFAICEVINPYYEGCAFDGSTTDTGARILSDSTLPR